MSGRSGGDGGGYVLPPPSAFPDLAQPVRPPGVSSPFYPPQPFPHLSVSQPSPYVVSPQPQFVTVFPLPPVEQGGPNVYPPNGLPAAVVHPNVYPPMPQPSTVIFVPPHPSIVNYGAPGSYPQASVLSYAPPVPYIVPPVPYPPGSMNFIPPVVHPPAASSNPVSPGPYQVAALPSGGSTYSFGTQTVPEQPSSEPQGTFPDRHSTSGQQPENGYVVSGGLLPLPEPPAAAMVPHSAGMATETTNGGSGGHCQVERSIRAPPGIGCSRRTGGSFKQQSEFVLLHGTLDVWVYGATTLPNMDLVSERVRQCCVMFSTCHKPGKPDAKVTESAAEKRHRAKRITSDPYVSIIICGARMARTRVLTNDSRPEWNEHFFFTVAHFTDEVVFRIKDDDMFGAQLIGDVYVPAADLLDGKRVEHKYDILGPGGKVVKQGARLHLSIQFIPVERDNAGDRGVLRTYFPLRKGCKTALYQDAHVYDGQLPAIPLENGKFYEHRKCWEEICAAILGAEHFIYIAGWSIYDKVTLLRDKPPPGMPEGYQLTLGDLLKRKSAEGVRVLLLVWDDKTSHKTMLIKTEGVMQTHDEETKKFFKHTGVTCRLAPRYASSKLSWFRQKVVGTLYTHHQKIVLLDSPREGDGAKRQLTAFVGGLDLCDGRYDTPEHSLFRSLQNIHKGDYHQPTFASGEDAGGPRQPWHDLHSRIEGPAAYDVLTNFEQRWKKSKWRTGGGDLIEIQRVPWMNTPDKAAPSSGDPALYVTHEGDPETWNDQIFRSIDSGSVKGFPKKVDEAEEQHLVCMKNIRVDASIHAAYVAAIRRAEHFIYIENQYFIGSSYHWPSYRNAGADHTIPMELALKIASKIMAGERFAVYVVIPMFPEGAPESLSVQEILYFQYQTMEMMYLIIADALRQKDLLGEQKPQDYLLFFCLGNREEKPLDENSQNQSPADVHQAAAQQARRFMIYVHSKGMVVDDEYIIIGSANINQRSMDGSRDTEIAMGSYQPEYTWSKKRHHPRGQVYGFRMSLWAEHTAMFEDWFADPSSLDTVRKMKALGDENWAQWASDRVTEMRAHLLTYPIQVEEDGHVQPLPGCDTFPDVGGKILGSSQQAMPDGLTS